MRACYDVLSSDKAMYIAVVIEPVIPWHFLRLSFIEMHQALLPLQSVNQENGQAFLRQRVFFNKEALPDCCRPMVDTGALIFMFRLFLQCHEEAEGPDGCLT